MYSPKKANSEKLGLGIENPCSLVFFFDFAKEQVFRNSKLPAFLESWSVQLRNDPKMSPQLMSFLSLSDL
jgi:hypothetical protein